MNSGMSGYNINIDTAGELCLITHFLKNNFVEVNKHEKNLSAKQYFTQAYPRISGKDGHKEWQACYQAQKSKRAQSPVRKNCRKIIKSYCVIIDTTATLPKTSRLRKRADFLQLASAERKTTVRGFLVVWRENNLQTARLGITASKKIGCAVVRNRVKRYLREFFRHNRLGLSAVDINIIARRESAEMTYPDIERELNKAFRYIGISSCSRAVCSL
jgi:ribonuclease P protein component